MYLTVKQQLKHLSKAQYCILKELSHAAKNLTNEAIFLARQFYFSEKKHLHYECLYKLLKDSDNYKILNSNMSQQILKEADGSFKAFFGLLKAAKEGRYNFKDVKLPHYLPKDGYQTLVIGFIRLNGNKLIIPFSNSYRKTHEPIEITIPPILDGKNIKEIRIIPKSNARFFEIQYTYEAEIIQRNLNKNNALAIDFGVNNLMTAVSNTGKSFIIDGKQLKSINQWYNKENARLQSIKDRQGYGNKHTKRQTLLVQKRNKQVNNYISKAAKMVITYCIAHDIGTLVVGYNNDFQYKPKLTKAAKQTFLNIPYGKLRDKLSYLCELNGITFIEQEESYTSKASFWDKDAIPVWNSKGSSSCVFSGKRISRGLYKTAKGIVLNADINGALNILRKSNVVSVDALYARGDVDTPVRIRVA